MSSENSFSFDISENKKIQNLEINSKINLIKLDYKDKLFSLKKYLPNFKELIKVKNHLITLKYQKDYWELNGKGKILIGNDQENINYKILKKKEHYSFHTGIQFFKSIILADTLKYKKDKDTKANLELSGTYNKNKNLNFDSIFFQENNNSFLLEGLKLNKKLKISSISFLDLNFTNSNKILNQINLRKKNKKYDIKGKVFDATPILETILDKDVSDSVSIYDNLNTKVKINIEKVYLDENTYVKKLRGDIQYRDNEIFKLNLNSFFPNNKSLDLTINTNDDKSKITTLYSDYPKPLVQRYKFIQGFSEGTLDFYSLKKNGITNSVLKIDNFKIKKVPVFAKLLTLASLQGISDLLTGEGIRFKDFEMKYSNEGKLMTIEEIYAIGPAVSIMIDGYIERKKTISLRGTLVPATTINRTISSIPLLGNILVGKKVGEGVFGVSFKIKGPPNNLKTTVNPIKTLTPRFITRTLEKIKKD